MNVFENGFIEPENDFPQNIVINMALGFEKATNGLATLSVHELSDNDRLNLNGLDNVFQFKLVLKSQYLPGYSFDVMVFGYDISIYPVTVKFEREIHAELGFSTISFGMPSGTYANEADFTDILNNAFSTSQFKSTVGGLMKIARSKSTAT